MRPGRLRWRTMRCRICPIGPDCLISSALPAATCGASSTNTISFTRLRSASRCAIALPHRARAHNHHPRHRPSSIGDGSVFHRFGSAQGQVSMVPLDPETCPRLLPIWKTDPCRGGLRVPSTPSHWWNQRYRAGDRNGDSRERRQRGSHGPGAERRRRSGARIGKRLRRSRARDRSGPRCPRSQGCGCRRRDRAERYRR